MQSLLSPPASSSGFSAVSVRPGFHQRLSNRLLPFLNPILLAPNPLISSKKRTTISSSFGSPLSSPLLYVFEIRGFKPIFAQSTVAFSSPASPGFVSGDNEVDKAKLAQVAKRLEKTSRSFKRLGSIGFWGQLVSTVVAAVILAFSVVVTGKPTSPATFYATASGIAASFVSVFWSFGYIRLSERLRRTAGDPAKAPPRADVVKGLRSGIMVNLLGMGAALLGMQATVGFLVAKALTTSANPFYQGVSQGYSPVLALDVFLVQASANTLLSHFLGLVCSLELLRSVTLPSSESVVIPKDYDARQQDNERRYNALFDSIVDQNPMLASALRDRRATDSEEAENKRDYNALFKIRTEQNPMLASALRAQRETSLERGETSWDKEMTGLDQD